MPLGKTDSWSFTYFGQFIMEHLNSRSCQGESGFITFGNTVEPDQLASDEGP